MNLVLPKFTPLVLLTVFLSATMFSVTAQDIISSGDTRNIVFVYQDGSNKSNKSFAAKTVSKKSSAGDAGKSDGRAKNSSASKNRKNADSAEASASAIENANVENDAPMLSGGILNGLPNYFEMPGFSEEVLKKHGGDEVKVRVTVDGEGNVVAARVVSGPSAVREAAIQSARRASFLRSRFMGDPVSLTGDLIYVIGAGDEYKKYDNSPNKTPVVVSGGVLNGKEISHLIDGSSATATGQVKVQVTVDEDGKVSDARAVSGNAALYKAAVESAKWWTFPRTNVLGNRVKVSGFIVIDFK